MTLGELAMQAGTDKGDGHSYVPFYESLFESRRNEVTKVLEIGVGNIHEGRSSLFMWRDYFPNAQVYGVDNEEKKMGEYGERINLWLCDQTDEKLLAKLAATYGPFDLIIDDGSHETLHQIISAEALMPYLKPDGHYLIEDVNDDRLLKQCLKDFTLETHVFKGPGDCIISVQARDQKID